MTSCNISHIILTRFNLPTKGKEQSIRERKDWLAARFELFETFCLPSVLAQSCGDFQWLIYFDVDTPEPYRSRILALVADFPTIVPKWVKAAPLEQVQADVMALLKPLDTAVITTRLDNDDALHQDFIASLRDEADTPQPEPSVYNFTYGLTWGDGRIFLHHDASNAFASLIEPVDSIKTVWSAQHSDLAAHYRIKQIGAKPMWLQVIHGDNVSNRVRGRRTTAIDLAGFAITVNPKAVSSAVLVFDAVCLMPWRYLKEGLRAALKPWYLKLKQFS